MSNMANVLASLITIGDELLIGQTIDTNSAWLATQLNQIGIWVRRRIAVGDSRTDILDVLHQESRESDIIIITGGLGPTADDITKPVLCEFFDCVLESHEPTRLHVETIFKSRGLPMLQRNLDQSLIPAACQVLFNRMGTAPGMWFEKAGKIFISLPGVPLEMRTIMLDHGLPRLQDSVQSAIIQHRTLLTSGMGESFVAERLRDFENSLESTISLAYLPGGGMLKLRLTSKNSTAESTTVLLDAKFAELKILLNDIVVVDEDRPLEEVLGTKLKELAQTISTAESCTGGLLAHRITSIPGSSRYYKGSIVAYADSVKQAMLHVPASVLNQYGAVSEHVVEHMVVAAQEAFETDMSIAVSGIMGPDGGSPEKPVGTVWMAVRYKGATLTKKYTLRYDRSTNTLWTVNYALCLALKAIRQQEA